MNPFFNPFPSHDSRIGFHYFPDTLHYRELDLQNWLPEFQAMGVSWLLLKSPQNRAIPEVFIQGLVQNGIEPLIQFDFSLNSSHPISELNPILEAYSRWGVKGVILFDRPNTHSAWAASTWAQSNLVEHFLDRYLPLAQAVDELGLVSILPPLQPAGSYWDTAFLRATLEGMERRKFDFLLDHLVLSCYAWTNQRSLNWGVGGPELWVDARPYATPEDSQDQNGFRVYEWYQAIARSVLNNEVPVILLQAGTPRDPAIYPPAADSPNLAETQAIAQLLYNETPADPVDPESPLAPIPPSVVAGLFYQLACESQAASASYAWFNSFGTPCNSVELLKTLASQMLVSSKSTPATTNDPQHPIHHYLLLPAFDWGVADWHLDIVKPFIKKYRPTVGFSINEAALAHEVTVIGNNSAYSEETLDQLRLSGSIVKRIDGIGIEIASQLAER